MNGFFLGIGLSRSSDFARGRGRSLPLLLSGAPVFSPPAVRGGVNGLAAAAPLGPNLGQYEGLLADPAMPAALATGTGFAVGGATAEDAPAVAAEPDELRGDRGPSAGAAGGEACEDAGVVRSPGASAVRAA